MFSILMVKYYSYFTYLKQIWRYGIFGWCQFGVCLALVVLQASYVIVIRKKSYGKKYFSVFNYWLLNGGNSCESVEIFLRKTTRKLWCCGYNLIQFIKNKLNVPSVFWTLGSPTVRPHKENTYIPSGLYSYPIVCFTILTNGCLP